MILAISIGAAFVALIGAHSAGRAPHAFRLMGQGEDNGQGSKAGGVRPRVRLQLRCAVKDRTAQVWVDCESARGRELTRAPEAEIAFALRAENLGGAPARRVTAVAPILSGFSVDAASVTGADAIEYSLDGKSFAARPMLEAGGVKRPAPAALYRHIRFFWREIAAGDAREARWTVRLR